MSNVVTDQDALEFAAANVRRALDFKNWSQVELAERAGTSQAIISNVLRQAHMPGVATMARIAEALETTVDKLVSPPPKEFSRQAS